MPDTVRIISHAVQNGWLKAGGEISPPAIFANIYFNQLIAGDFILI